MRRREVVHAAGAVLAAALAGCSDGGGRSDGQVAPPDPPAETTAVGGDPFTTATPTPDPAPNLNVASFRTEASEDDTLVVLVDVRNVAGQESTGLLVVSVSAGGESYDRERQVTVAGDATETFEFEYPVTVDQFRTNGSLDFAWREADDGG